MKNRTRNLNGHASLVNMRVLVADGKFLQNKGIKEISRIAKSKKLDGIYIDNQFNHRRATFHNLAEIHDSSIENGVMLVTPTRQYDLRGDTVFFFDTEGLLGEHYRKKNQPDDK